MRRIAIVGSAVAGFAAARALRRQSFDGEIVVIGAERHQPYDRPPLSKAIAVATLLSGGDQRPPDRHEIPYFWSDQYGVRIQFAGHREDGDAVRIVEGDTDRRSFLALYERDGRPVAVLGMNQSKLFTRWRRQLGAPMSTGAP